MGLNGFEKIKKEMQEIQQVNLRDILTLLFKHKNKILLTFLGIVFAVTGWTFVTPPTYEAESTLMVKMGREHVYRPEIGTVDPSISFDQERIMESEIQIMTSRNLAQRVIERLGVNVLYSGFVEPSPLQMTPLEASIREMQDNLHATIIPDSNVIRVAFRHDNAELSAQVVKLLVAFLLEKHLEMFSNPQASFLEKQAIGYEQQLNNSKNQLQDFKHEHGLSSLIEEQKLLLEQRRDLDTSFKEIQNQRQGLVSKLASLKAQITQVSDRIPLASVSGRQKVIDDAKTNLLALRLEKEKLSTKYKDSSRRIRDISNEILTVEDFIREQEAHLPDTVTTGKNPVYQELEIEIHKSTSLLDSLKTQTREIKQQLHQLGRKLVSLDELEKELQTLELKVESDQDNYRMYLSKVEEARVSEQMDQLKMANIRVIQDAVVPAKPIKPKKALNIGLSIIIGAIVALLVALASEYVQGGYSRPEYVARDLKLPILTSITHKT